MQYQLMQLVCVKYIWMPNLLTDRDNASLSPCKPLEPLQNTACMICSAVRFPGLKQSVV